MTVSSDCDGSKEPALSQHYCYIKLSTLRAAPYSLNFNNLVEIKIRAHNKFGWSNYSPSNVDGARVQVEPVKISKIVLNATESTLTSISLSWTQLASQLETGGSQIQSY